MKIFISWWQAAIKKQAFNERSAVVWFVTCRINIKNGYWIAKIHYRTKFLLIFITGCILLLSRFEETCTIPFIQRQAGARDVQYAADDHQVIYCPTDVGRRDNDICLHDELAIFENGINVVGLALTDSEDVCFRGQTWLPT